MEENNTNIYGPPVDQLLTLGEAEEFSPEAWPNYLEMGIGPEQIPALIRMATDEELDLADLDSEECWAPIHAVRALGQLRATEAIEPLLSVFESMREDDWIMEELPETFGLIGPAALPALATFIADDSKDDDAIISAISSVHKIGERWPDARSDSVTLLINQLERYEYNDPDVNGFLVLGLVKLHATEAASLIEEAFEADSVEEIIMGDWDDVQVELGLLSPEALVRRRSRETARQSFSDLPLFEEALFPTVPSVVTPLPVPSKDNNPAAHKKAKNKMAKQSRKKNRKR